MFILKQIKSGLNIALFIDLNKFKNNRNLGQVIQ